MTLTGPGGTGKTRLALQAAAAALGLREAHARLEEVLAGWHRPAPARPPPEPAPITPEEAHHLAHALMAATAWLEGRVRRAADRVRGG